MPTLSVIILTKNEARNIRACIESAGGADEVLVIDDESADSTAALAKEAGAAVIPHRLENFAAQRDFALTQVQSDWVFFLDADERFSPKLMDSIRRHIAAHPGRAASLIRRNFAFGHRHRFGPLRSDSVTRLFPKGGVRWEGQVHERPLFPGPVLSLSGHLEHHTYSDWNQYLAKQFRYADIWAKEKHAAKKSSTPARALTRAALAFLKMFILNLGLLGGPECWCLCAYHSLYTLTKYLKLAELNSASK